MNPSAFTPSSAMLVGLLLTILYMFIGVMAFAHAKPDADGRVRRMRMDPWWPFRADTFDVAGRRLCGPGKVLLVAAALAFVAAAWASA